jgi:predicted DNA-binding transcriptional regulator YafY
MMSARLKLAGSLPASLRQQAFDTAERFHLDAPGWFTSRPPPPHLEALAAGVFGDLTIEARYRARAGERGCRVEPLGLVLKAGTWYVVAREGDHVRGYRADRFSHVFVTDQRFSRPAGFELGAFWTAWQEEFARSLPKVTVTVRARACCVPRLRRVVEPGYKGEVDWDTPADETGWVRLPLPFEKLAYAQAELLALGPDVEVLGPPELRARMAATAVGLAALYAGSHLPSLT